jgi:hypothetical protein
MENNDQIKIVTYNGLNNLHVNKKTKNNNEYNKDKNKSKKRVESENWTFDSEYYKYENQMKMMKNIHSNNYNHYDDISKIALQQINKKIYGYKQQDIIKKLFNKDEFITLHSIIDKMCECKLKCYYCLNEMNVLYDISRESKQWTVDRIDNDMGHNLTNFYLACLECNLKRRRRSDDKFLFTKQMKIVKVVANNSDSLLDSSLI